MKILRSLLILAAVAALGVHAQTISGPSQPITPTQLGQRRYPLPTDVLPYTYNLVQGSQRWRDSLGRVRDTFPSGSATQYGVDVLVIGDSTGAYGNIYDSWPHLLKVMLQERFNKPGVVGGFGFMPYNTQGSTVNDWNIWNVYTITCSAANATVGATYTNNSVTFTVVTTLVSGTTLVLNGPSAPSASGTLTKASGTGDATITFSSFVTTSNWAPTHNDNAQAAAGLLHCNISPQTTNNRIWRYFDPTPAYGVFQRQGITDWEAVGWAGFGAPNYNTLYMDSSTSNGVITPSNIVTIGSGSNYGQHWTVQSGLTATVGHTIQVATTSTDKASCNGVILYNGDFKEGVRLHNLSSVGSSSDNWYVSGDVNFKSANIDNWCSGGNGGAVNGKLYLVNTMLNDCGITSGNITPAAYTTNMQGLINQITAAPSRPCVGLIVNIPWDIAASNATQLALYTSYRQACYALADANPQTVFVIDYWKMLTDRPNMWFFRVSGITVAPTAGATYTANGITYTVTGTNTGSFANSVVAATGANSPGASGTLTKTAGTGDATVSFSACVPGQVGSYANYGPNCAGGATFDRGWYNDGTHGLSTRNQAEARMIFSVLAWGN